MSLTKYRRVGVYDESINQTRYTETSTYTPDGGEEYTMWEPERYWERGNTIEEYAERFVGKIGNKPEEERFTKQSESVVHKWQWEH